MKLGRPLKFQSVEELKEKIDSYFKETEFEKQTITGLALYLDTTRELLCDYALKDDFSDTIKRAKLMIENAYELRLIKRGGSGDIFALKNFGWKDRQDVGLDGGLDENNKPKPLLANVIHSNNSTTEDSETK